MNYSFGSLSITKEAIHLANEALNSGRVTQGNLVSKFEKKFAEIVGVKEAVAVSSGTDADVIALSCLYEAGAKRGDEVILPALSFVATGNAVIHAGFKPVFVDVEKDTYNLNPSKIEPAISERTRAIMPVHLMGKPAKIDEISEIARRHNLYVIEDAAEAHGAKYHGKCAGSLADIAAFSLYAAHIISSVEGGIITTNNKQFAEAARSLRSHGRCCVCPVCIINTSEKGCRKRFLPDGRDKRFLYERIGYSSKMNELEAAIGLGSIGIYEEILEKRRHNLTYLIQHFKEFSPELTTFNEEPHEIIGPHAFPIITNSERFTRDEYSRHLNSKGIDTRDMFASMPTQYPSFEYLGHNLGDFSEAEHIGNNGLHVGVHQHLTDSHLDYFLSTTEEFLRNHS